MGKYDKLRDSFGSEGSVYATYTVANELAEVSRVIRYWMKYNNRPTDPEEAKLHSEALEDQA